MGGHKTDDPKRRDPREVSGLIAKGRGIRKRNLEKLLEQRSITPAELERTVGITNISEMISGKRRMSNAAILRIASALQVSPLFLLDLTDNTTQPPCPVDTYAEAREQLCALIYSVFEKPSAQIPDTIKNNMQWEGAYGEPPKIRYRDSVLSFTPYADDEIWTMATAANEIIRIAGDYRDLDELAQDLQKLYPRTATAMLALAPITESRTAS